MGGVLKRGGGGVSPCQKGLAACRKGEDTMKKESICGTCGYLFVLSPDMPTSWGEPYKSEDEKAIANS